MKEHGDGMEYENEKLIISTKENWFCPLPFRHIYSDSTGCWAVCCLGKQQKDINTKTVDMLEWWNSDDMNNLRKEMLGISSENKYISEHCKKCLNQEKYYGSSTRQKWEQKLIDKVHDKSSNGILQTINNFLEYENIKESLENNNERFLELKLRIFGNLCNLSCYMCWPHNSTTRIKDVNKMKNPVWTKEWGTDTISDSIKKGKSPLDEEFSYSFSETIQQIKSISKNIEIIKITGGEPLMLMSHYDMLDVLVETGDAKHISLKYQTNFTKFDKAESKFQYYISKFKHVDLSISLDSIGDHEEYVRKGSDFSSIDKNLNNAKKAFPNLGISIANTVSLLTIFTYNEFRKKYYNYEIDSFILSNPHWLDIKHLPDEIKENLRKEIDDERILNALNQPRDDEAFQKALQYCLDLDVLYGRNKTLFDLWPQLEKYYIA